MVPYYGTTIVWYGAFQKYHNLAKNIFDIFVTPQHFCTPDPIPVPFPCFPVFHLSRTEPSVLCPHIITYPTD